MTVIKTGFNATTLMRSVLEKSVSPTDIASLPACLALSVFRDNFVDSTSVGSLVNLANPSLNFTQSDIAEKPELQEDASLGRKTGYFNADSNRYLDSEHVIDYTAAYSMLGVVKIPLTTNDIQMVLGNESTNSEDRVGIRYRGSTNAIGVLHGGSSSGRVVVPGQWYAILTSFDGASTITIEVLGQDKNSGAAATAVTTTNLKVSSDSGFTLADGSIDMVALFNEDIFDPANSEDYGNIKLMLKSFYGSSVSGL